MFAVGICLHNSYLSRIDSKLWYFYEWIEVGVKSNTFSVIVFILNVISLVLRLPHHVYQLLCGVPLDLFLLFFKRLLISQVATSQVADISTALFMPERL